MQLRKWYNAGPQASSGRNFTPKMFLPGKSYATAAANRVPEPTTSDHR